MPDNQDKNAWCQLGEQLEREFLLTIFNSGCSVFKNPAKVENKFSHDFFLTVPCDLKSVREPFRSAQTLFGIKPENAVTLNVKDVKRYSEKYPNIIIIFDVNHKLHKGIYILPLQALLLKIAKGTVPVHEYKERRTDKRNAKDSYVLDVTQMAALVTEKNIKKTCHACNGEGEIAEATGDRKNPFKIIPCPHCQDDELF